MKSPITIRLDDDLERLLDQVCRDHIVVPRPGKPAEIPVRDKDDRWVLASAVKGKADILVTGDRDLLDVASDAPVRIVDPRGYWTLVEESSSLESS